LLLEVETNEDLELVKSSLSQLLSREWNIYGSKKHEVPKDKVRDLFNKFKDLGIFQFVKEDFTNALIINEIIGENLLPGIIASTAMVGEDDPITVGIKYVPEAEMANFVLTPNGIAGKDKVKLERIESPDPSINMYKVISGEWSKSEMDFDRVMLMASAQIVGHGIACMREIIEYSRNRIAFGKPIGSYQAIKHRIVDDVISLELVRSRYLTIRSPSNARSILEHAFRKSFKAILDSIQMHGGIGFTADLDLHLHLKRIIALEKIFHL